MVKTLKCTWLFSVWNTELLFIICTGIVIVCSSVHDISSQYQWS